MRVDIYAPTGRIDRSFPPGASETFQNQTKDKDQDPIRA